jgi:hypothetical protein
MLENDLTKCLPSTSIFILLLFSLPLLALPLNVETSAAASTDLYHLIQITDNEYDDVDPSVFRNEIVWVHDDGNDGEIMSTSVTSGLTTQLTDNEYDDRDPSIARAFGFASMGEIVWSQWDGDDWEIQRFHPWGGSTSQVTKNKIDDVTPTNDAGILVWSQWDGDDWEILQEGVFTGSPVQLTDNEYDDIAPCYYSGQTVWSQWDGDDWEILRYDESADSPVQLTDNEYDDVTPSIYGDWLVWSQWDDDDWEILRYDTRDGRILQATQNEYDDVTPSIYGDWLVWSQWDGDDWEILWTDIVLGRTIQLTDNEYDDITPSAHASGIAWSQWDGDDWEIMYTTGQLIETREPPTVTFSPIAQSGRAGSTFTYLVTITNNDPPIFEASTFTLEYATLPSDWTAVLSDTAVLVDAGATDTSVTLNVTSPTEALAGNTTIAVVATSSADQTIRGMGSGIYEVVDRVFNLTLTLDTDAAAAGARIRINGVDYEDREIAALPPGEHRCEAVTPVDWKWLSWTTTPNLTITNPSNSSTTVIIKGNGVLGADWGPMVTFHCTPSTNGTISVHWDNGITEMFSDGDQSPFFGHSSITAHPHDGYHFVEWISTGPINLTSPTSAVSRWNVTGPGVLTATFQPLISQLTLTLQPTSTTSQAVTSVVNHQHPASLHLYDSLGGHIGYNASTAAVEITIPNGSFAIRGDIQQIAVLNPSDTYELHIVGATNVAYILTAHYLDSHGTIDHVQTVDGIITADEYHTYSLNLIGQHLVVMPLSTQPSSPPPPPIHITLNMVLAIFAFMSLALFMITQMEQAN